MMISRRSVAKWRRFAPALQLAVSVLLGQACAWFADARLLILLGLIGGCFLLRYPYRVISGVVGGMLLGIASTLPMLPVFRADSISQNDGVILARVTSEPRRPRPGEIIFEVESIREPHGARLRCRAIDLPWRNSSELMRGDVVWIRGDMTPVQQSLNPFSWQSWLWRKGITSECKARFVSRALERNPSWITQARDYVHELVDDRVGDTQGGGLFLAMALGYQDLLSTQVEKAFMRLGLTHLLVVSGYQVSLMFGFVFSLLSYLIGIIRYGGLYMRGGVAIVAFIFAALYVSFIGAEMSSIRALIAAACVCLTVVTERVTSFAQRWGVALLFMQLIWPWCFFDIGVILTFAALLGIGLGSEFGVSSRLWSLVSVTFCVWVMTSLVVIVWQGTVSPVGLLLNLTLAAPWSIANCVVGLIGLLALLLGIPGAAYPLKLLSWINSYLAEMALIISESRYSGFELSSVSRVVIAGIMVTLAIAIIARYSASVSSRVLGMPVGKPRWI